MRSTQEAVYTNSPERVYTHRKYILGTKLSFAASHLFSLKNKKKQNFDGKKMYPGQVGLDSEIFRFVVCGWADDAINPCTQRKKDRETC